MALSLNDYKAAAEKLGVEVAAVRAIAAVESNGSGFFKDGRATLLYERHIFYRELTAKRQKLTRALTIQLNPNATGAVLDKLIGAAMAGVKATMDDMCLKNPDVCNPETGGYLGGVKEYDRLQKAKLIDEECALRSCSWGAFQLMGFHAETLGLKDINEFIEICKTEAGQMDLFVRFILKNPNILKALRAKNWRDLARYYNGPSFEKNQYDTKLAAAYNKFVSNPNIA